MMFKYRRILALCLLVCTLLCAVGCTPADEPTSDDEPEATPVVPALSLTEEDGSVRYIVVRPELKGTDVTKNAAVAVRNGLAQALGVESKMVSMATDWEKDPTSAEVAARYEILVGEVNRPESQAAMAGLGETDYLICVEGNKIIITGGSETAVRAAAEAFMKDYLSDLSRITTNLRVTGECEAPIEGTHWVKTVYPTEDSVVADIMPFEMGYDVDPSGVSDSTGGIQKALNDCAAMGGGTVFLSVGQYRVTKTIVVPTFVTLRGDWQDPDLGNEYGTVIVADVTKNVGAILSLSTSSGARGLTFYYPHQNAENPVDLGWAIEYRRDGSQCANVMDITLLNAYNGVGFCQAPYQINANSNGWFRNIKGTALNIGFSIYNNAGACSYELMKFSPSYWLAAGEEYNAPDKATLEKYLRENATAIVLGDLEMPLIYKLEADGYKYGLYIADGQRWKFWGAGMAELNITNCEIAMYIEAHYVKRMSGIIRSTLEGSEGSIVVADTSPAATILVTDCELSHEPEGGSITFVINNDGDSEKSYVEYTGTPRATSGKLYVVTEAPYNCPMQPLNNNGNFGSKDATPAIQKALDDAGKAGGGVVYLPAGYYRIEGYLTVPAGVELRGAGSIPMAPGNLGGTILLIYAGEDPEDPATAQAAITVTGDGAGVRYLQFLHPNNPFENPNKPEQLVMYGYTIRLDAKNTYVMDCFFNNPCYGIDVTSKGDDHYIKRLGGTVAYTLIHVDACKRGWIESLHDINPTYWMQGNARYGMDVPWMDVNEDVGAFMGFQQKYCDLIVIEGTDTEYLLDILQFAGGNMVVVDDGATVIGWNLSVDQGGQSCVAVYDGLLIGMNVQRTIGGDGGTPVCKGSGEIIVYNEFHLLK